MLKKIESAFLSLLFLSFFTNSFRIIVMSLEHIFKIMVGLVTVNSHIFFWLKVTVNKASSRAPGLTAGLQGSVNVHRGALLLVPQ